MSQPKRRLASEFKSFCLNNEFEHSIDKDQLGADVTFEHNGRRIKASYLFSEDDNRYDAGANLYHHLKPTEKPYISQKIFTSQATRGITERITRHNSVVGLTSRDGLRESSSATHHSFFLDDISRWAEVSDKIVGWLKKRK